MNSLLTRFQLLLVAVALAGSSALACTQSAVAQQPQTPTELWEEYPLNPEPDRSQAGNDGPQPRRQTGDGAPVVGDDNDTTASGEDAFPLVPVILTLSLLLLGLAAGMGVLPRGRRVPELVRERFSAVRDASPRYHLAAADVPRRPRPESLTETPGPRAEPAPSGADRSKRSDVGGAPAQPPKPKAPPAHKRRSTHKPPEAVSPHTAKSAQPAKPAGAVKPQRALKPGGAAKPSEAAKASGAVKVPKPARSAKPKPPTRMKPGAKPQTRRRRRSPHPRTEPRPVDEQAPPVAHAPTRRELTCSIFGWRDGRVADFYAVAFGLQGRDWIVERSPRFLWSGGEPPAEAYEAHAILVEALLRAGWRRVGNDGAWYRQRFERPIETAPERP
jgi:hypothetical protein